MASTTKQLTLATACADDACRWTELVENHPGASLAHAFEWKAVMERAYSKPCHYLLAHADGQCQGVLPLVHMKGRLSGNRLVSMPFLDQGGLLARSDEARELLWKGARVLANRLRVNGIELRHFPAIDSPSDSEAPSRVTMTLDLPSSEDQLWKSFRPKVRNQVRKAEKAGLCTRQVDASQPKFSSQLNDFYDVFCRNMRDLGSPVHSVMLFQSIFDVFGDRARLFLTEDDSGRVVGGAVALRFAGCLTVPWASSLRSEFRNCPNHSLYWKILASAVEAGDQVFDFGRSMLKSGTYEFKRQWRAEARPLSWEYYDAHGKPDVEHHLRPDAHTRIVRIWKRLPLSLTKWIGPTIRCRLAN